MHHWSRAGASLIDAISGGADLRMPLVIGAIGHRDLVDEEVELLKARMRELEKGK